MCNKMSFKDERNISDHSSSVCASPYFWSRSPSLRATVPFSWEHKPGVPKHKSSVRATGSRLAPNNDGDNYQELPPPPLLSRPSEAVGNYQLARPRRKFKKATLQRDDPFMVALVECTKQKYNHTINSVKASARTNCNNKKNTMWYYLSQMFSIFSCKGPSCLTSCSRVSLPRWVCRKTREIDPTGYNAIGFDPTSTDGKMSDYQVFEVLGTRNYSNFYARKQG